MENHKGIVNLHDYSVRLYRLSEEDGGGWLAEVPELDGCKSDGETPEEALRNLQGALESWLEAAEEDSRPIPAPEFFQPQQYSGRFTLRLSKSLHRFLSERAKREGVSLNQLILTLISVNAFSGYIDALKEKEVQSPSKVPF